jgi:hypothetical protein
MGRTVAFDAKLARAIGLTGREIAIFRGLKTPSRVQDFISLMPVNFEPGGATCHSVRTALARGECHCIEGAFIAACALMLHGEKALLLDFQAEDDDDHVLTLFKRDGCWGAISKSNSIWLRWRDPVYRSVRELAMSYFHEYIRHDHKSLRRMSARPFNIAAFRPEDWITKDTGCWDIAAELDGAPHVDLVTGAQIRHLRKRDALEIEGALVKQFKP